MPQDILDASEGDDLAKLQAHLEAEARRRVMEDARRRDASIPPLLARFNNGIIGHRQADRFDAAGAAWETAAGNAFLRTPEYSPSMARDAAFAVAAERDKLFEAQHPNQAMAADVMADIVQEILAKRFRIPAQAAPALYGAVEGADAAGPGERLAGAATGAARETLLDMAGGQLARRSGLDEGMQQAVSSAFGTALERAAGAVVEAARPTSTRGLPNRASLPRTPPQTRPPQPRGAAAPRALEAGAGGRPDPATGGVRRVLTGLAASLPTFVGPVPIARPATPLALALYETVTDRTRKGNR
jgi:hypothetical protein